MEMKKFRTRFKYGIRLKQIKFKTETEDKEKQTKKPDKKDLNLKQH